METFLLYNCSSLYEYLKTSFVNLGNSSSSSLENEEKIFQKFQEKLFDLIKQVLFLEEKKKEEILQVILFPSTPNTTQSLSMSKSVHKKKSSGKESEKFKKKTKSAFSITQFIPIPLWEFIFDLINNEINSKKNQKNYRIQIFGSLRLCCKTFRNLISKYWIQCIPLLSLESYFRHYKDCEYCPQSIYINSIYNENAYFGGIFEVLQSLPSKVKEIKIHPKLKIHNKEVQYLPSTIEHLDLENCSEINGQFLKYLPPYLKTLNIRGINKIKVKHLKYIPSSLQKLNISEQPNIEFDELIHLSNLSPFLHSEIGTYQLINSIEQKNFERINFLLENGVNLNQVRTDDGATPLFVASQKGYLEIVKELINNGANLNQGRTIDGSTPLFVASQKGYLEIVKALLENGVHINQALNSGFTPLYIASQNGYLEIVKELINNGANINQHPTDYRSTPLFVAFKRGHINILKELIRNGADVTFVNYTNFEELFPRFQANYDQDFFAVITELTINLSGMGSDNKTNALHVASQNGNLKLVKELINNGSNINKINSDGATPLFIACQNGYLEIVKALINNGANVNQTKIDNDCTPLYIACQNGYLEIVKELINNGANVNQGRTNNGCTPLYIASQNGHLEIVKELINNGANLNPNIVCKIGKHSYTPFYIAWKLAKSEIFHVLKDVSDIKLNIQLAKQNNQPNAVNFFKSLLKSSKMLLK